MTDNKRSVIANNLTDSFKINQAAEIVPARVNPNIQPVFEVWDNSPTICLSTSGQGVTIYTTPLGKSFYLKNVILSGASKSNDSAQVAVFFTPQNGSEVNIRLDIPTGHAGDVNPDLEDSANANMSVNFDGKGLKLSEGTLIRTEGGVSDASFTITGYEVI